MPLASGGSVVVTNEGDDEVLEVLEVEGRPVVKVRFTAGGPEVTIEGANLRLKAPEAMTLEGKAICFDSEGALRSVAREPPTRRGTMGEYAAAIWRDLWNP